MPAPRRRNTLFGFLSKGSKHKRIGGHDDQEEILSKYEEESNISYQEDNICDDLASTTNHDRTQHSHNHHNMSHEDESYGYPDERPEGTEHSTHSLTAKPTTATLAETFSSGAGHDNIHFVDSKDQSEVENSQFMYADGTHPDYNEYDDYNQEGSYTEFHNATLEDDDTGTLDYTATVRDAHYGEDHSESHAARHVRVDQYAEAHYPEGVEAEWEDGSTGYDDTCSRTLNTNLEGMNYISEPVGPASYQHSHIQTVFSNDNADENVNEPQYYYQDEEYDLYQESFGAEGYYYDDEGQLVGQPNQEEGGHFFDGGDDQNTLGNSTIATELDGSMLGPAIHGPIISNHILSPHPEEDIPFDTYESDDSRSSSDDEETRDLSLLDDDDDDDVDDGEEDDGPEENDKGDESDSDSDDESRHKKRGRRRRKPKSFMAIINEMQRCSMKGSSLSYDDDDSSDDDDDDSDDDADDDREDVPDVAQVSTGATSVTSMTDSYHSRKSGQQASKKTQGKKKKSMNNFDNLFNTVSALGQELLGAEEPKPSRKGKKASRRRDQDPATRIVESLRDIFSCGNPTNY